MEIVIELGDFDDNWTVLSLAVARLARGDQGGMEMLLRLRSHIIQTGEGKSRVYILPCIEGYLKGLQD